jgi:hypothetical protein
MHAHHNHLGVCSLSVICVMDDAAAVGYTYIYTYNISTVEKHELEKTYNVNTFRHNLIMSKGLLKEFIKTFSYFLPGKLYKPIHPANSQCVLK